jgi:membrane protein YdbS with pleckstrin-like domain
MSASGEGDVMSEGEPGVLRLRAPKNAIDRRARPWWWTQWALVLVPIFVTLGALAWLLPPARSWLLLALVVLAVPTVPAAVFLPLWWYRVHRWEITEDAVYTRKGRVWREWRVAPMSRIQTVDIQRGPVEQLFGLATVTVTTASAKGAVTIPGLDHELAAELVDQLTRTTQATPGDAT